MFKKANAMCLLEILREYSDEEHILKMSELIAKMDKIYGLSIERKTVYSAIAMLIDDFKYDISIPDENGGKGYYLRSREFDISEVRLIMDSIYSNSVIPSKQTADLIRRLQNLTLSVHQQKNYSNMTVIRDEKKTSNKEIFLNIEILDEAILKKSKVQFTYLEYGFDKKLKPRRERKYVVSPYSLVAANEHYYLICNYENHDGVGYYRIDKICDIEILSEKITPSPTNFNVYDYTKQSIYMFGGNSEAIELKCHNKILGDVIDKFGLDVRIIQKPDDTFNARFTANIGGVKYWALQYLQYCEVLLPQV